MVEAHHLVKRFGDFVAVDGVDFTIARGESFGFLGPNGAGKTSTMRMISCISPVSGGTLRVLGMDPATRGRADPGPDGTGPTRGLVGPRPDRSRQPHDLRPLFRHAEEGDQATGRPASRVRPADRTCPRQGGSAVGRHEAKAHDRPRPHFGPRPSHPRRADDRARPPSAPFAVGSPLPLEAAGRDAGDHHALHGRGRAVVRPPRRHGQGSLRRRGKPAPAHRATRHQGSGRAALPARSARVHRAAGGRARRALTRSSPTGSCSIPTTGMPRWPRSRPWDWSRRARWCAARPWRTSSSG